MDHPQRNKARSTAQTVLEFSGIGIQVLVTILLFNRLGIYVDQHYSVEAEYWTIGLTLTGVGVALYFMIKGLMKLPR